MQETYTKTTIAISFIAGILITLGLKDLYPDLQQRVRRYRQRRKWRLDDIEDTGPSLNVNLEDHSDTETAPDNSNAGKNPKVDIKEGIEGCIGNTPLIRIKSLSNATGCEILAKAEFLNGAGNSPKDRVALSIINHAEKEGLLHPNSGDVIYEGTVGSTGISLAAICRARGYKAHICMPSDQATEKSELLLHLGATVDRNTPVPIVDPTHYVNRARTLAAQHTASPSQPGHGFFADQFENEANWRAHYEGTGREIWAQTGGRVDAFVCGAGTGGTITGVGMYLKEQAGMTGVRVVLADPQGSGLYNKVVYGVMFDAREREGTRRRHQVDSVVEGIGVNRVTANFERGRGFVDGAVRVSDGQAVAMARWLVQKDGIFVGSSSAVNCVGAVRTAMELGPGHTVVTVLCDSGTRHLSRFWKEVGDVGDADENMDLSHVLNC